MNDEVDMNYKKDGFTGVLYGLPDSETEMCSVDVTMLTDKGEILDGYMYLDEPGEFRGYAYATKSNHDIVAWK